MDKFCKRLKEERLQKNLTQGQLSQILDIDRTSISKYENGKQLPELHVLNIIADFFDVSLDYITGRSEDRSSSCEIPNDLWKQFGNLSKESKEELEKYLRLLRIKDNVDKGKDEQSATLEKDA